MQGYLTKLPAHKYGAEAEAAALDASNRGFRLLQKMGWMQGTGLGKRGQGIVEPVRMKENLVCLGLGKAEEYDTMTEQATRERRKLDAEVPETLEEAQSRLVKAAQNDQLKGDVLASHAAFLCRDCQKQYKTVKEMENHLSSYDHHHHKRLQELLKKPSVSASEQDAKRKREQQQEAAMLQKRIELAAAASATAAPGAVVPVSTASTALTKPSTSAAKVGFSFGGGNKSAGTTKKLLKKPATVFSPFGSGS